MSRRLTSCLTAIKNHVVKYCETVYERNGKIIFWSITNSGEIPNKLKSKSFLASSLFTHDFSTLYTTLSHTLIKEELVELIEQTFNTEGLLHLACNEKCVVFFSRLNNLKDILCCNARRFVLDNILIKIWLDIV